MEPDVIRVFSSSPPPLDEAGEEEEEDEFGEFGSFGGEGVSSSFSFSELDTPTTFNQSNALEDSPPDLYNTSMRNHTLPGKSGWANERMKESQFYESSKTEPSGDKTETHNCVKNTGMEAAEILMNGVTSPDLEEEFSDESSVTSSGQHSPQVLPEKLLSSTGNEHSLCNGFSESDQDSDSPTFLQSTETGVNSGLDDVVSGSELEGKQTINHTDSLQDSDTHSSYKEEFEPGETREEVKLDEEEAPITAGSSCDEHFVVCDDTGFLEESKDCVDIAETAMGRIKEVDLISDTQLHRDTRETHGSSANTEVEVDKDINAFNETPADLTADEDFGDFRDATQGFADVSQTESITQDGFADFVTAMSRCSTDDEFGDTDTLKDFKEDEELEEEKPADLASAEGAFCSELPPSDSFADFSSAPFGGVAVGENWATFEQHESTEEGQDSWAEFGEEHSTFVYNEKQDVTSAVTSSDNLQSSRTNRDANLFQTAFPSDVRPEVSEVTEILTLQQVLQVQDHQEQKDQSCSFAQGNASAMWHHLEDIHGTYGLKIKWAGSHSNRLLLDCLGIRNILFTGDKKQPMIVPAFAAGLGMLEPTKESQKSPASPALSSTAPLGSGDILCTQVLQVASCSAVSVDAQDGGISELNLDYFGPVDECSSDSENDTPLPGVDPELYELTTAKMENNTNGRSIADAFTKLMESMDKNRTTARKPEKDEKMSEEAARVISHLPDLSFMKARVLMFPPVLTPSANHT